MGADRSRSFPATAVFEHSSSLANAAYDASRKLLEIEFRDRSLYRYTEVPSAAYAELLQARSKGQYFNTHIRNKYPSIRISPA